MKNNKNIRSVNGWELRKDSRRNCYAWLALPTGLFMFQ